MNPPAGAPRRRTRPSRLHAVRALAVGAILAAGVMVVPVTVSTAAPAPGPAAAAAAAGGELGPNVHVLRPSMPQSQVQSIVDDVAAAQLGNQFGDRRDALLFLPGTYGSAESPLNFQVGYYTEVAGLGRNPRDVVINGTIDVFNQCDAGGTCLALNNFWRSLSNLTIDVANPSDGVYSGCHAGQFWAVSQASPMRRVQVNGATTLMDYCSNPAYASGGFIADSRISSSVTNGSQQQFVVRNSAIGGWSNGVWNQVFAGVDGAPSECFPQDASCGGPYTTLATTPASKEKPYLMRDARGYGVFVPNAAHGSSGPTWSATTSTPGRFVPVDDFFVAGPADSAQTINQALAAGKNLLLTPGVYALDQTLAVNRADTIVLGLGLATLTPTRGQVALAVGDVTGVDIAGITVDAGATNSSALIRVGSRPHPAATVGAAGAAEPTALQDVFFRVGGARAGRATTSLVVNSDNVILDDVWAWRADHGTGVGWTENTAQTGLVVRGDDVTATGLFVEHYQGYEVLWGGERGQVVFFQNEMPYDVPSQAAWNSGGGTEGYAAFKVTNTVQRFSGAGMGSYSFFNQGVDIFASHAFEVPVRPGVRLHDLLTVFLDPSAGSGGIRHVVNDTGGSSTAANPSTPVTVVDYP